MDDQNARPEYSRQPTLDDLVQLCQHLNEAGARYVVVGGFAVILNGFTRTTGDVDLLVDSSSENIVRIKKALLHLPDQAIREIDTHEVAKYTVVRVADEIVVDLMHKACGITYDDTRDHVQFYHVAEVRIPFLKPAMLLKTKMTLRPKDAEDRFFLESLLEVHKTDDLKTSPAKPLAFSPLLGRFWRKLRQLFLP